MKINKHKKKENKKNPGNQTPCYSRFPAGSFAVHIGDHFRFGIICGSIWRSFPVWGSFAALYRSPLTFYSEAFADGALSARSSKHINMLGLVRGLSLMFFRAKDRQNIDIRLVGGSWKRVTRRRKCVAGRTISLPSFTGLC